MNEYTILTIDNSRSDKKEYIRSVMRDKEIFIDCVDGKDSIQLRKAVDKWQFPLSSGFKLGEFGVWYSTANAWEYAAEHNGLLVFEDDAMPIENFQDNFYIALDELPSGADFLVLWIPENQKDDYYNITGFNRDGIPLYSSARTFDNSIFNSGHRWISRVYNGYGGVAIYYTKAGGRRLIDRAKKIGLNSPVDCWIYQCAHGGYASGYGLNPRDAQWVNYDWTADTTIHKTSWVTLQEEFNL